jgi:hypothetical protein
MSQHVPNMAFPVPGSTVSCNRTASSARGAHHLPYCVPIRTSALLSLTKVASSYMYTYMHALVQRRFGRLLQTMGSAGTLWTLVLIVVAAAPAIQFEKAKWQFKTTKVHDVVWQISWLHAHVDAAYLGDDLGLESFRLFYNGHGVDLCSSTRIIHHARAHLSLTQSQSPSKMNRLSAARDATAASHYASGLLRDNMWTQV